MIDLPIYLNFLFAFLATVGFAIYFNAPKISLIPSGIVGGIGWILYIFLFNLNDSAVVSTFFAQLEWKIGLAWANTSGSLNSPS